MIIIEHFTIELLFVAVSEFSSKAVKLILIALWLHYDFIFAVESSSINVVIDWILFIMVLLFYYFFVCQEEIKNEINSIDKWKQNK